jgi:hypothetical protein
MLDDPIQSQLGDHQRGRDGVIGPAWRLGRRQSERPDPIAGSASLIHPHFENTPGRAASISGRRRALSLAADPVRQPDRRLVDLSAHALQLCAVKLADEGRGI